MFAPRRVQQKKDLDMNKTELLNYFEEHCAGSYIPEWEKEPCFSELTNDKQVVLAMVVMSDAVSSAWSPKAQ